MNSRYTADGYCDVAVQTLNGELAAAKARKRQEDQEQ